LELDSKVSTPLGSRLGIELSKALGLDIPRRPNNLKVHNTCYKPETISKDLLDSLGLNLGFGISMPPKKDKIPIDFERVKFIKSPDSSIKRVYNPKLYIRKEQLILDIAQREIEEAINKFKEATKKAFHQSLKNPHVSNLKKARLKY
jgi:hypothetical protein